jgi:phosphoribosylaminoimidazolecarboxamide formyltransferase/IMP cyclohydrolase
VVAIVINPKRALISVFDKTGIVEFAQFLAKRGVELVSTGGTARSLRDADLIVRDVSELTGFPEMMDGRLKTLHPKVHGGLLGIRDNRAHAAAMIEHGIEPIDLLVVNLYPFAQKVADGASHKVIVENIDIGGPAMLRAGAKNHESVAVISDPGRYTDLMRHMVAEGGISFRWREVLAGQAYRLTASYDAEVSGYFRKYTDHYMDG